MQEVYITDAQIAARYGVHRATPWRWAKTDPLFPRPLNLTAGCTRWKLSEIEAWELSKSSKEDLCR